MLWHRIPIAARRSIDTHIACQIGFRKAYRLAEAKAAVKSKCQMTLTYHHGPLGKQIPIFTAQLGAS